MAEVKVSTKLKNRKKSALKAARVSERRRVINLRRTRAMKDAVKEVARLISEKKGNEATALLPKLFAAVDKAVKGNVIKKNTAARIKSRVSKRLRANA